MSVNLADPDNPIFLYLDRPEQLSAAVPLRPRVLR